MTDKNAAPFEFTGHTKIVTHVGAAVVVVTTLIGAALWADNVTDTLRSIDERLRLLGDQVGTIDDVSVRRSVLRAWINELRAHDQGWLREYRAKHPDWAVPERIIPDLPTR